VVTHYYKSDIFLSHRYNKSNLRYDAVVIATSEGENCFHTGAGERSGDLCQYPGDNTYELGQVQKLLVTKNGSTK
jgi:hypothetical protein